MPPPTTHTSTSCATSCSLPGVTRPFAISGNTSVVPSARAAPGPPAAPANAASETPFRKFLRLKSMSFSLDVFLFSDE